MEREGLFEGVRSCTCGHVNNSGSGGGSGSGSSAQSESWFSPLPREKERERERERETCLVAPCIWLLQPVTNKAGEMTTTKPVSTVKDTAWWTQATKAGESEAARA